MTVTTDHLDVWQDLMRARSAEQAHAVVDEAAEQTLRQVCERWDLDPAGTADALRDRLTQAVQERAEDLALYEEQDQCVGMHGVPDDIDRRRHDGCGGVFAPVPGTQFFEADGGATIDTECTTCGVQSYAGWVWSRHTAPAEDPTYYAEDDEDTEAQPDSGIVDRAEPVDDGRRYALDVPRGMFPGWDAAEPDADHHTMTVYGSDALIRQVAGAPAEAVHSVAFRDITDEWSAADDDADDDVDGM